MDTPSMFLIERANEASRAYTAITERLTAIYTQRHHFRGDEAVSLLAILKAGWDLAPVTELNISFEKAQ